MADDPSRREVSRCEVTVLRFTKKSLTERFVYKSRLRVPYET